MAFNLAALENGGEVGTIYQTGPDLDAENRLRSLDAKSSPGTSAPRSIAQFAIAHSGLKIDRGTDALRDIDQLNGMRLDAELLGGIYGVYPNHAGAITPTPLIQTPANRSCCSGR